MMDGQIVRENVGSVFLLNIFLKAVNNDVAYRSAFFAEFVVVPDEHFVISVRLPRESDLFDHVIFAKVIEAVVYGRERNRRHLLSGFQEDLLCCQMFVGRLNDQ